jgi:curved DNA-binding protein CbpA
MQDIWSDTGNALGHGRAAENGGRKVNYYEVLGLSSDAPQEMIREAYLRNKQIYGSDSSAFYSLMSSQEMADNRALIDAAFEVLGDPRQRTLYNQQLGIADLRPDYGSADLANIEKNQEFQRDRLTRARAQEAAKMADDHALDWTPPSSAGADQAGSSLRRPLRQVPKVAPSALGDGIYQEMEALIARSEIGDGHLFRDLRILAGVGEAEIQDRTKISLDYIQAIENNSFERLPQSVYVRGFLRSYLQYINAPSLDALVKAFTEKFETWDKGRKN